MTPAAVAHARTLAESLRVPPVLRIRVIGGGCNGLTLAYDFGKLEEREGDTSRVTEEVTVVVDGRSAKHLRGAVVDLGASSVSGLRTPTGPGPTDFVVHGLPKSKACGCGESFEP